MGWEELEGPGQLPWLLPRRAKKKRGPIVWAVLWGLKDVTDMVPHEPQESSTSLQRTPRSSSPWGEDRYPGHMFIVSRTLTSLLITRCTAGLG